MSHKKHKIELTIHFNNTLNITIMKKKKSASLTLIVIFILSCLPLSGWSETPEQKELKKQYAEVIKRIKKENKVKTIDLRKANDGTIWFVADNSYSLAMFNSEGKQITPFEEGNNYFHDVRYYPAADNGFSDVPQRGFNSTTQTFFENGSFKLYHRAHKAVVVTFGNYGLSIYTPDGEKIRSIDALKNEDKNYAFLSHRTYPGYIVTGFGEEISCYDKKTKKLVIDAYVNGTLTGIDNKNSNLRTKTHWTRNNVATELGIFETASKFNYGGIYTIDGKTIADSIIGYSISEDQYCIYTRNKDGVNTSGVIKLDDPSFNIPCMFAQIIHSKNKWLVKKSSIDPLTEYNPKALYATEFRDDGEKYYNQEKWQEVIDFYSTKGLDKPWALFFTGMALFQKAYHEGLIYKTSFQSNIEKNDYGFFTNKWYKDCANIPYEQNIGMFEQAATILQAYTEAGDDSIYIKTAKRILKEAGEHKEKMEKNRSSFRAAINKYDQHNAARKAALEAERQQKAAMWGAILGAVSNALQQSLSSGSGSAARTSVSNAGSYRNSPKAQGATATNKEDNTNRKIFLKNQIIDWKNKLKKAEASRSQALDNYNKNPTHEAKRVVESKENTVNECLNMIRQYESELNSLK